MALSDQPRDDVTDVRTLREAAHDGAAAAAAESATAAGPAPVELEPLASAEDASDARKHVRPSFRFVFSHP
ncbi:MAG: hypothetical protein LBH31_04970, partial [Burkholderiaceae bacterium]|nr:hypothetical protein [Burkholderiaceae bacterium]